MMIDGSIVANGANCPREMFGAAIFQIIARDRGDDDVFEFQPFDRLGHTLRLVLLERERLCGADRAKSTGSGAAFTRDHHGGRALAPAFPAIRALGAFANGMEAQIRNERLSRKEDRIRRQPDFDPGRFLRLVKSGIDFSAGHFEVS